MPHPTVSHPPPSVSPGVPSSAVGVGHLRLTARLASLPAPALASSLTACTGSWDGPSQTACELLGAPGTVSPTPVHVNPYLPTFTVLYERTALDQFNELTVLTGGELSYWTGTRTLSSVTTPLQFAYWPTPGGQSLTVGIEDLTSPSDWDYNDYIVRFERRDVPETGTLGLLLVGLGSVLRRWRR